MINNFLEKLILENRKITVNKVDTETGEKLQVDEIEENVYKLPHSDVKFKILQLNNDICEIYIVNDDSEDFVGNVYKMNDESFVGKSNDVEVSGKTSIDAAVALLTVKGLI
jgi:hypothetical protein